MKYLQRPLPVRSGRWFERMSQPRVDRFAFQREEREDAFVDLAERGAGGEAAEGFVAQGELQCSQCTEASACGSAPLFAVSPRYRLGS